MNMNAQMNFVIALADLQPVSVLQCGQRVHQPGVGVNIRHIHCLGGYVKHLCQRAVTSAFGVLEPCRRKWQKN